MAARTARTGLGSPKTSTSPACPRFAGGSDASYLLRGSRQARDVGGKLPWIGTGSNGEMRGLVPCQYHNLISRP